MISVLLHLVANSSLGHSDRLAAAIEMLIDENEKFANWLQEQHPQPDSVAQMCSQKVTDQVANFAFLQKHLHTLQEMVDQLRDIVNTTISTIALPHSSTPYRRQSDKIGKLIEYNQASSMRPRLCLQTFYFKG